MTIEIGDRLPPATFICKSTDGSAPVELSEIVSGKLVVLVGMPGAFTPTCHLNHLPGFLEHLDTIKGLGVDEVAVVCVNDHHVMAEWAKATKGAGRMRFLADYDGAFTRAIGMDVEIPGLGLRSKRYSLIADDGVVRTLNLETQRGKAVTSGAAIILDQLRAMTN